MPESAADILEQPPSPQAPARHSRLLGRAAMLFLLLFTGITLFNEAATLFIRHSWLRRSITWHLSQAFGRPVEVANYQFSIWAGPEIVADNVSVAEDPRFGNEYFLRAESLSARLAWSGLLRGHLVLGRVLLSHPSLNLVRGSGGGWNFAQWLPRPENSPPPAGFAGPVRPAPAFALNRIEVDSGRVNFKSGDEKFPFALVDVNGFAETQGPGRWRLDLSAAPLRAPIILQQPGVLHVVGDIGGTSSRLRPASLQLFWTDASVSDLLRLARDDDSGVRGLMNLEIIAATDKQSPAWALHLRANLSGLHRWDLAARSDNPALVLLAAANFDPSKSSLEIVDGSLDAPRSHLDFASSLDWTPPAAREVSAPDSPALLRVRTRLDSAGISLSDLLSWLRAFRADVASDIALDGTARLRSQWDSWPPRLTSASLAWDHVLLTGPRLRVPLRLSTGSLEAQPGRWSLAPVTLAFGDSDGALRLESPARSGARDSSSLSITGQVAHARDLISSASAFGWVLSRGWDLQGPLRCDLHWPAVAEPWREQPLGTADWGTVADPASLQTPFLNQPVLGLRLHADWKPGLRSLSLASAEAFGARWTGSFNRRDPASEWQFALSADHLSAADLDRWLNPRWRQSFLARLLPFLNPSSPAIVMPENLGASGTISVAQLSLSTALLHQLEGDLSIRGRTLELSSARAQMYGGAVSGSFLADLHSIPSYSASVRLARVDLAGFQSTPPSSSASSNLSFAGLVSGPLTLRATGSDRASLASSLSCDAAWEIQDPEIRGMNLADSLDAASLSPGISSFRSASAEFSCAGPKIRIRSLRLASASQEFDLSGAVDLSRNVSLRARVLPLAKAPRLASDSAAGPAKSFSLTGNLSSLQIQPLTSAPPPK